MSRYDRFREILDLAAGDSSADHGGIGPFSKLDWNRLLKASIFTVPLIAPDKAVTPSCCGHGGIETTEATRSARSGLVTGLHDEAPFDGSQFPQLPWGGRPVAESDVYFIAQWIDDGRPRDDSGQEIGNYPVSTGPVTIEREGYSVYEGSSGEYQFQHGELKQRMNLACLTPHQVEKLRWACKELYELNKWPLDSRSYNNLALIHQNHCQHGWERFLSWHRVYMYEFEQSLQDHCPEVTLPGGDGTLPQYPRNPIPNTFQMFLTDASLASLPAHKPIIPTDKVELLRPIVEGLNPTQSTFFAAVAARMGAAYAVNDHRKRFIDALLEANPLWYSLRDPGQFGGSTIDEVIHFRYPSAEEIQEILSLRTFRDFGGGSLYNDSFGLPDQNPHNTLHIWTGGEKPKPPAGSGGLTQLAVPADRNQAVQVAARRFHTRDDLYTEPDFGNRFSNLTVSYDPIFWPVHSNGDRLNAGDLKMISEWPRLGLVVRKPYLSTADLEKPTAMPPAFRYISMERNRDQEEK